MLSKFGHVSTWVFDLDNTLYPADCGLWPQINQRVTLYLAALTGLDGLSARALQRYYYHRHGTTLRGLVEESAIDPEPFLDFVHDVDRSGLRRDARLAREIERLPGRRLIFTNGSRDHALRTVAQLGLDGLFEDAFDIVASGLVPKPAAPAYEAFFDRYGVDPAGAAMFEDIAKNLQTPKARGMTTTLVAPRAGQRDDRDAADGEGRGAGYVDFVTDDLAGFLERVNDRLAAPRPRGAGGGIGRLTPPSRRFSGLPRLRGRPRQNKRSSFGRRRVRSRRRLGGSAGACEAFGERNEGRAAAAAGPGTCKRRFGRNAGRTKEACGEMLDRTAADDRPDPVAARRHQTISWLPRQRPRRSDGRRRRDSRAAGRERRRQEHAGQDHLRRRRVPTPARSSGAARR